MTDQSAESEESRSATDDPAPSGKIPPFPIWWPAVEYYQDPNYS